MSEPIDPLEEQRRLVESKTAAQPSNGSEIWLRPKIEFQGRMLETYSAFRDMALGQILAKDIWRDTKFSVWAWLFIYIHTLTREELQQKMWDEKAMMVEVFAFADTFPPSAHEEAIRIASEEMDAGRKTKAKEIQSEQPDEPSNGQGQP